MQKIKLEDYLLDNTQYKCAKEIGVTPSAIWQMLRAGRHIEITVHDDGSVVAHEIKPIGKSKAAA